MDALQAFTKAQILQAAKIVEVVSDFVELKKVGNNYYGKCPFDKDCSGNFSVSPQKNYCKCFGCGKGGNPIGFIMEHEGYNYPVALRWLARKYGIKMGTYGELEDSYMLMCKRDAKLQKKNEELTLAYKILKERSTAAYNEKVAEIKELRRKIEELEKNA